MTNSKIDQRFIDGFANGRHPIRIGQDFCRTQATGIGNADEVPGCGQSAFSGADGTSGLPGFHHELGQQQESFVVLQALADLLEADGADGAVHSHWFSGISQVTIAVGVTDPVEFFSFIALTDELVPAHLPGIVGPPGQTPKLNPIVTLPSR